VACVVPAPRVYGAAAIAVLHVRLARAIGLVARDDLGLIVRGTAAGVALAFPEHVAGCADRERGDEQGERDRAREDPTPLALQPMASAAPPGTLRIVIDRLHPEAIFGLHL